MQVGLSVGGRAVALADLVPGAPATALDAIAVWEALAPRLAAADATGKGTPLADVRLHCPLESAEKMMAIGLNYADHIEEARGSGLTIPTEQVWFTKMPSSLGRAV